MGRTPVHVPQRSVVAPHGLWARRHRTRLPQAARNRSALTSRAPSPPHLKLSLRETDGEHPMPARPPTLPAGRKHGSSRHGSAGRRTPIMVLQGLRATLRSMAWPAELDTARLRRDTSLALRRKLTVYAGVGAAGLTATFALIAASTAPGRATPASIQPPSSDPLQQDPGSFFAPEDTQPGLISPAQPPQNSFGGPPAAVSGGS